MPMLSEVAGIYAGYAVQRRGGTEDPEGNALLVRGVNVSPRNDIDWSEVIRIRIPEKKARRFLEPGDVLVKTIGLVNTAVWVGKVPDVVGAVPHQHFLHIRLNDPGWDPAFLAVFLNSDKVQAHFRREATGATLAVLRRRVLEEFELPELSIEVQRQWVLEWQRRCDAIERLEAELKELKSNFNIGLDGIWRAESV